jgi:ABC-type sugar transport system ATPase subunit
MVGRELSERFPRQARKLGKGILSVTNWTVQSKIDGRIYCKDVSFQARQGEILGIAGLAGSGRSELFMNIFHLFAQKKSGQISLNETPLDIRSAADAHEQGLALVTEDRKHFGLIMGMSIEENASLASLARYSHFGFFNREKIYQDTRALADELKIKCPSLDLDVAFLSGGNQQKVVLAKCLLLNPKVLILDEPTRGIDVGARIEIYKIMNHLLDAGVIVIMISSDLPEVLGMSDRILVFHEGKISGEILAQEATQEKIMSLATGQGPA